MEQTLFNQVASNLEAKGFGSSIDQLNRLERIELLIETATNHLLDPDARNRRRAQDVAIQPLLNLAVRLTKNPLAKALAWAPWIGIVLLFINLVLLLAMIGLLTKPALI